MTNYFQNKVAIVTGAASGIGRELARELASQQATLVVLADRNLGRTEEVAAGIRATGGQARAVQLDVTDSAAFAALLQAVAKEHGRLDLLINNAGIAVAGEVRDLSVADCQEVVAVNFWGVVHGTMHAYHLMVPQGFGQIVNVASRGGMLPIPIEAIYCATKHAVVGWSRALRTEAEPHGVRVNVACPGLTNTGLFAAALHVNVEPSALLARLKSKFKFNSPEACARAILRGAAKNREIIYELFLNRCIVEMGRRFPFIWRIVQRNIVRDFQKIRQRLPTGPGR